MSFNWRTEEERGWDPDVVPSVPSRARAGRRRLAQLALLSVALIVAATALWRTMQARADRNLLALEEEVRASHALAQRAAAQGDGELLTALLSGRDEDWTDGQLRLLREGLLFEGAAERLGLTPHGEDGTVSDVSWSPDLQEALVTSRYTYTVKTQRAAADFVSLEQTVVYRRGAQRWLLAPPDDAFWGAWQSRAGQHVALSYRERDAEAAARMLPVLDEAAARLCRTLAQSCLRDEPFAVQLAPDAEALWRLQADRFPRFRFGELTLPSPSLIGEGAGERAQEAINRGYALYLLIAVTQRLLDFDCCQGAQYMDALALDLASDLGYGAERTRDVDYVTMVDNLYSLEQFRRLWWGAYAEPFTETDRAQVTAFVEYLRQQSGASTVELLRALADSSGFWEWNQQFAAYDVSSARPALESSWRGFVLARANAVQAGLMLAPPAPQQVLTLVCADDDRQHGLYSYDPQQDAWAYVRAVAARIPALAPTPGDEGVVIFDRLTGDPTRLPARLVQGDRAIPLPGDLAPAYSLAADPQGRFMPMWRVAQSGRTIDGSLLLDVTACLGERGCEERSLNGLPSWSPSGEQVLLWNPDSGRVTLFDRDLRSRSSTGLVSSQQPFWLDERTVGLVSEAGEAIEAVEMREDGRWTPQQLLSLPQALAALGRDAEQRNWRFAQTFGITGDAWALVGAVTLPQSGARHYFVARFDGQGQLVDLLPLSYVPQLTVTSPDALISGEGAWFALHLFPETLLEARFVLHDLETGKVVMETRSPFFNAQRAHDWSADGQWLARIGPHYVELATDSGDEGEALLRRFVNSGQLQCSSVAWVNR